MLPQQSQPIEALEMLPLIVGNAHEAMFAGPAGMNRGRFRACVAALAASLPDARFVINLCERRDHFIAGFCAAAVRGQVTLMPPSRAQAAVEDIRARYPNSLLLGDTGTAVDVDVRLPDALHADAEDAALPMLSADADALIAFTSGSTGVSTAHRKQWSALWQSNAANFEALKRKWSSGEAAQIVATVPPQHMYGMELSVLLPLMSPVAVHTARPFFPQDIARALEEISSPRLLVTTPVHLRALLESGVALPALAAIVTATAPLLRELAQAAEDRFDTRVREFFGSTETCVIAQRRTACEDTWELFEGVHLAPQPDGTQVTREGSMETVVLADLVELDDTRRTFTLRGRQADMLEIAGKRASLGDLTRRLQAIEGVRDGVMLQTDADAAGVRRLLAIIVADDSTHDEVILDAMRGVTDPVFLPRRIIRVQALPRNETGKLPRQALLALISTPSTRS